MITTDQIETLRALCAERDTIQEKIAKAADAIEQTAHAINKAGHRYARSGYYPWFQRFDDDGELIFEGDNSWDGIETYGFMPEQLLAGPEPIADEYTATQRTNAERELAAAEQRASWLREQLDNAG